MLASELEINPAMTQLSKHIQYDKLSKVRDKHHVSQADLDKHYEVRKGNKDIGLS